MGAGAGEGADVGAFDDIDEEGDWGLPKGESVDDGLLKNTLRANIESMTEINEAIRETLKQVG